MKNKAKAICEQQDLTKTIGEFSFLFKDWKKDDQCFLNPREAELLLYYSKIPDEILLAKQIGTSPKELNKRIQYILSKIQFNHRQYRLWQAGLIPHIFIYPPFVTYDHFLSAPLKRQKLSSRFYNVLYAMGCKTMKDVLSHSVQQLLTYRNIGEQSIGELKNILWQQDCCHLLME